MAAAAVKAVGDCYAADAGAAQPAAALPTSGPTVLWAAEPVPPDRRVTPTGALAAGGGLGLVAAGAVARRRRSQSRRRS